MDQPDHYRAGVAVAAEAVEILRQGRADGSVHIAEREMPWLERMQRELDGLPLEEGTFIEQMMAEADTSLFLPQEYGVPAGGCVRA